MQLGENVSITADKSTNSLVINAGKADYEKIKSLLQQLDIKRRQVLVEALLMEVSVDDSTEMGLDFLGSGGGKDGGAVVKSDFGSPDQSLTNLFSNPASISKFSVAAASAGTLSLPGGIKIPTQSMLLTAAQSNTNVNVLSSPNLLTTDNEEAEIVVGQNVPFLASRSTNDSNLNNTFNQIDRQDVGITLRLTPQISSQSFVTMKIFTEVSSVVNQTDLGPTTAVRTSETTVIAKDGQMVVMGGLLADTSNNSDSGVPFLKDVPIFGHLFKSSTENHNKTNLLILITPRIVRDQFDHRDLTVEKRDGVEEEIASRDVYPDRHEVLRSPNIDKVTEALPYEGAKPSTILPPDDAVPSPQDSAKITERAEELKEPTVSKKLSTDSPGVIKLKISPKFPSSITEKDASPRGMLKQNRSGNRFYLFESKAASNVSGLPFSWDKKTKVFGVEMPEGSAGSALEFFKAGNRYRYAKENTAVPVTVVGAYASRKDAESDFSGDKLPWYTLSPYEVMGLGSSLWLNQ